MSNPQDILAARLELAGERHPKEQREAAIDALAAVIEFLRESGAPAKQTIALTWLGHELTNPHGNTLKPLFDVGRKAIAAAAIDALMTEGDKLKPASIMVAKSMGGAKTDEQLRNWRKNVREGKLRPETTEQYYRASNSFRSMRQGEFAGALPQEWRAWLLALVQATYGEK